MDVRNIERFVLGSALTATLVFGGLGVGEVSAVGETGSIAESV